MAELRTSITLDDSGYQAAARRVVDANVKIVDSERQIVPATTGSTAAFERLKRSLDPVYDAQKKIEKATRDAEKAIRDKLVTEEQAAAARACAEARLEVAGHA